MPSPKHSVSVVIPCFNDGSTLQPIVNEIKKSIYLKEIIVVDDGSNPQTKNYLSQIKGIKLITHPHNLGKSQALKTGVMAATGAYVAFIDSDLLNFTSSSFDNLVAPVVTDQCDVTLGNRQKEDWYGMVTGFALAYTGERCLSLKLLKKHLSIFNYSGYLIEAEFNRQFFNHYRVNGVLLKNVGQISQPKKKKGLTGWFVNWHQVIGHLRHLGPVEMFGQIYYVKRPGFTKF